MDASLIITGMHRSGTSMLAGYLHDCGMHLGDDLLEPTSFNREGYFEERFFVDFHDKALRFHGRSLYSQDSARRLEFGLFCSEASSLLSKQQTWGVRGWKDPRTVLFLDSWNALVPDAMFVFVFLRPEHVIDFLRRRGDKSLRLQFPLCSKRVFNKGYAHVGDLRCADITFCVR